MSETKERLSLSVFICFIVFSLLRYTDIMHEQFISILEMCFTRVIPSLFPFFVVNELIIQTGLCYDMGRIIGKPLSKLFSVSKQSSVVFILGLLGGFPLGAKSAVTLYDNKIITKEESQRLILFCNNTGPGFIMGFCSFFAGGKQNSFAIYISQIITAFIFGFLLSITGRHKKTKEKAVTATQNFDISVICSSVSSSVIPMLNVCAFVLFFSLITSAAEQIKIINKLSLPIKTFIFGILEITKGISLLTPVYFNGNSSYDICVLLCGFFVGFGGLSVAFQTYAVSKSINLNPWKYIFIRFLFGLTCSFFSFVICKILQFIL